MSAKAFRKTVLLNVQMKIKRTYLYIAVFSIALLGVLAIQVNWILRMAKAREDLFNEKANMILSRTAEALAADAPTCGTIVAGGDNGAMRKVDSMFNHFMNVYNFHLEYTFEVKPKDTMAIAASKSQFFPSSSNAYCTSIDESANKDELGLKLVIPGKEEFIRAEMGLPFIVSVLLILVVLFLSWRTILSLMKEKQISEHTTDFLNNMTHEFKTPLTNIALAGNIMLRDPNIHEKEKVMQYTGIILEENEKLSMRVEQMLRMSSFERGEVPMHRTRLDLHTLIMDAVKNIRVPLESREGEVLMELNAQDSFITGDRDHIGNVLCNLLDNAIKYSPGKPGLSVRTINEGTHVMIMISDKGIGIAKEYQRKVFEKFFRIPTGYLHDVKGYGLGLAYVKKIVELHGGSIYLQSEPGRGTTFVITLPNE